MLPNELTCIPLCYDKSVKSFFLPIFLISNVNAKIIYAHLHSPIAAVSKWMVRVALPSPSYCTATDRFVAMDLQQFSQLV